MIKLSSLIHEIYKEGNKIFLLLVESRVDDFKKKYETLPTM